MCFLVVRNVDTDIVGLRQQNIRFFAEFFYRPYLICVLKWCLPYICNRPTRFPSLQHLGIESKCMSHIGFCFWKLSVEMYVSITNTEGVMAILMISRSRDGHIGIMF